MAYEYDRLEREDGGGSFLMGLLAGTVLGAGLGILNRSDMFATIAFNAHTSPKLREKNRQVMNEILAGNATGALALLKNKEDDSNDD